MRWGRTHWVVLVVAMLASAALASNATARNLYVTNENSNTVSVIDGNTNQVVGSIPTGPETGPWTVAITPDGKTAYAGNYDSGTIVAIDTATNQVVGPPITIPKSSYGLAITPDGTRGYIANGSSNTVTAIDLQARQTIGAPIEACVSPSTVVITPDGSRAYVTCDATVRVLDLASNTAVGAPLPIENTYGGAVTPDGKSVYLADYTGKVVVIDTATNQATSIATGGDPQSVAISPDGRRAYASDYENKGIMVIDTATRQFVNPLFPVPVEAEFLAVSPDGRKVFAGGYNQGVAGLDTATSQPTGLIATGEGVGGLAFVPDQSPLASFAPPVKVRPGVVAAFNGSASSDPDGTVANYAWQFGDGATATGPAPTATYTYAKPGAYSAVLTVTDNEGCSVPMVFTGQTASCHGSPAAAQTQTVEVKYPGVKVKCPKKAGPKGCKFKLKAVKRTGKGKKKLKAQSAVAKAKVKAGKSAIVSLKPTKKFAKKLATAKKTLVQQTVTAGGETTTKVGKLKIVE
jgi:YVTN family beta-propeller protein